MRHKLFAALAAAIPALALGAPVGLDGVIGSDWSGVTAAKVLYDAAAPNSNFGAPGNKNNNVGYDIYVRRDANYLYAALKTTGPGDSNNNVFANLYLALLYGSGPSTSLIGFEVTNDRAFFPSASPGPYYNDTAANLIQSAVVTGTSADADVIETAIDLSVFTSNALGVAGFTGVPSGEAPVGILMFLSQSFGYSVAGGTDAYGATRLGFVDLPANLGVPEPGSLALVGAALVGLVCARRRKA